ncbi:hypothetical protein TNCV_3575391, partial [Trichonephila clavipes]
KSGEKPTAGIFNSVLPVIKIFLVKQTEVVGHVRNRRYSNTVTKYCHGFVCHEFEPHAAENPPCRGAQSPPIEVVWELGKMGAGSDVVLVT